MKESTLSVVISVHNEGERLAACLKNLKFGDELVVVLDRCNDSSRQISIDFGAFQKVLFFVIPDSLFLMLFEKCSFLTSAASRKSAFSGSGHFCDSIMVLEFLREHFLQFLCVFKPGRIFLGSAIPVPVPSKIPIFKKMHEFKIELLFEVP